LKIVALKKILLPFPPLELQKKFSAIVTQAEVLKEDYKNSLVELENLYRSLSQRAFKGELEFSKPITP
jgi:type I restriction enzyme S subunit